jgi:hypothetical protein
MAFKCLANHLHVPPGGWEFTEPLSKMTIHGGDYFDLREKVRKHRTLNLFVSGPEIDNQIQEQICSNMSAAARARFCRECSSGLASQQYSGRTLSLDDVKSFLIVAKSWVSNPQLVSAGEANRRAEICAGCPKNVPIAGCHSCRNLVKWSIALIGHRSTPFDNKLGGCEVCGCGNQAQVHLPLKDLQKGITPEMAFPSHCWKSLANKEEPVLH